ncbi:Cleavage and polyadenylation specificity factor subunit 1 [Blyttiomyces sp. JEL0837]|nr:Cleavage and polyadenylation specificity factor subunit 1 [Blyttiomyces sp. JEL0837]
MFALWKDALNPTAIDHAVEARFTSPDIVNLIVCRGNLLQVFKVEEEEIADSLSSKNGETAESSSAMEVDNEPNTNHDTIMKPNKVARLVLMDEHKLMGTITSIAVVRPPLSSGIHDMDSLLMSFRDAKMSLVEYNRSTQSITTVSIHYYERDEFKRDIMVERRSPEIRSDPDSRCVALNFYGDRMAILPFKQDMQMDDDALNSRYPFQPSFVFLTSMIDPKVKNVIDFAFLHNFFEPTLAILYETTQTWTGRLAARRDTRALVVVSLDISRKAYPILFQIEQLPYNCASILPMPSPIGGLVIVSPNALIHVDQTSIPGVACVVNKYYGMEVNLPPPPPAECLGPSTRKDNPLYHESNLSDFRSLGITLEGCVICLVNPDTLLLVLRNGETVLVEMIGHDDAGSGWRRRKGGVKRFNVVRLGWRSIMPLCACRLGGGNIGKGAVGGRGSGSLATIGKGYEPGGMTWCYFFIGSRTCEASLLQISEVDGGKLQVVAGSGKGDEEAGANDIVDKAAATAAAMDDDDDDLYGDDDAANDMDAGKGFGMGGGGRDSGSCVVPRLRFRVCDSLPCIGPIRDMAIGEPADFGTEESQSEGLRRELEIVACSGEGIFGSLSILNRNARAKVLTSVELSEVQEVWSVRCSDNAEDFGKGYHTYLVLSQYNGSTILKTGEELQEMQESGFYRAGNTVSVGSVLNETCIVQVHPNGVFLLNAAGRKLQEVAIGDEDRWIVSASILDPYVMLLLNDGGAVLIVAETLSRTLSIIYELKASGISAASLYCDETGGDLIPTVSQYASKTGVDLSNLENVDRQSEREVPGDGNKRKRDDMEEDDLYGEDLSDEEDQIVARSVSKSFAEQTMQASGSQRPKATRNIYCFAYRENGSLEVLRLPDFQSVYLCANFDQLPTILSDVPEVSAGSQQDDTHRGVEMNEIIAVNLGRDNSHLDLFLMGRTELGDLIMYRAFPFLENFSAANAKMATPISSTSPNTSEPQHRPYDGERLALRFVRVQHEHLSRDRKSYSDTDGDKLQPVAEGSRRPNFTKKHYLRPFTNVGSVNATGGWVYDGVFMSGNKPCWIMMAKEGAPLRNLDKVERVREVLGVAIDEPLPESGKRYLRVHPCVYDGEIRTFAPFHNVNIQHGFVYVNGKGLLRLCQVPWQFNYDTSWPVCRVPLRRTPNRITYHYDSQTYVMAASTSIAFFLPKAQQASALAAGVIEEGEELEIVKEKAKEDRTGMYFPTVGSYNLELVSPVTWETVDRFAFEEYEHVLCCQAVTLHSKQTTSGTKLFLAVGTGISRGEDLTTRGRIMIFEIIDVVPEIDNPQTCHKFKLLHTVEEKNPISALCGINGYLLCAIGPKIIIYSFEDAESLVGVAFLDVNIYVVNVIAIKSIILIADIAKSVWFCGFQEDPPQLRLLGKDYHPLLTMSTEFLIDDNVLSFLVSDSEKNMHIMAYAPHSVQSLSGQKLIRRGELHVGSHIQKMLRLRKLPAGTLDGGLCVTIPVSEKLYKRLYAVYSKMVNSLQHLAGLNPRGYRQLHMRVKPLTAMVTSGPPGPKSVLDGTLLFGFLSLPVPQQRELAKAVGSTIDRIIDDLIEIMDGTEYF